MTIRYVGEGGDDGWDGLTWGTRKLTLNGVEDTPVVAGDTVYVGPGTYREMLTIDVTGTSDNPIKYIGDPGGLRTDGVGGVIRITAFDSDTASPVRQHGFYNGSTSITYREFHNFYFDVHFTNSPPQAAIYTQNPSGWLIDGCVFANPGEAPGTAAPSGIYVNYSQLTSTDPYVIRNCVFWRLHGQCFTGSVGGAASKDFTVENCVFFASRVPTAISTIVDFVIRNCTFVGGNIMLSYAGGSSPDTIYFHNNAFGFSYTDLQDATSIIVDSKYNISRTGDLRIGEGSTEAMAHYRYPALLAGFKIAAIDYPLDPLNLVDVTRGNYDAGAGPDLFGLPRSTVNAKRCVGATQYVEVVREAAIVKAGSTSIEVPDAQPYSFLFILNGTSKHTFEVHAYREANYAGTNPQMILRRPGRDDIEITDTGSVATWNKLSYSLRPYEGDKYVQVIFASNNSAGSGSYKTYFDKFEVRG